MPKQLKLACYGLVATLLTLSVRVGAQETTEPTIPVPGQIQTAQDALVALTRDSGNAGFGKLMANIIALEVATAPLVSSSGGFAFLFDDVAEAQTSRSRSYGPLLLERALTSGHLATSVGLTSTTTSYDTVSDLSLNSLRLASFTGASPVITSSTLDLGVQAVTNIVFGRIGLGERIDVAGVMPIMSVSIDGTLTQEEQVVGTAVLPISTSSVGLGDIGLIGKLRLWKSADDRNSLAALVTVRAPTGDAENLRGVDAWRTLVSGTATFGFRTLATHVTGGYEFWNKSVGLSNVLPGRVVENWTLADQLRFGAGVEIEAHPALSISVDAAYRKLLDSGRLEARSLSTPVPSLGIDSTQFLAAGPRSLQSLTVGAGARWSPTEYVILSAGALISPYNTGLRSKFTLLLGLGVTFCKEC